MKRAFLPALMLATGMTLLSGCVWSVGSSGPKTVNMVPTIGQQLIDLQKARDTGAINDAEYQQERQKILNPGK
jgi:hypothetical protein